jgi:hypothetical protein
MDTVSANWPLVLAGLAGLAVVALLARSIVAQVGRSRARAAAIEQLGLRPCPEEKARLEETVARIECNSGYRYEVRDPRRLAGEPAVYYYVKLRHRDTRDDPVVEEEILFPLKRRSAGGLVLIVKPSSLKSGLAVRMLGTLATTAFDAQPDDLHRLTLPPDLRDGNLVAALGPRGASLYDLIDERALGVAQGLGDAGGIFVRLRDGWCSVAGTSAQIPFRLDEIVTRIRPLL